MASSSSSSAGKDVKKHVLYLTVHGMGQREGKFVEHLQRLDGMSEQLCNMYQEKYSDYQFHFLPVEWNKKLHSLVDDKIQLISLPTVPLMRHVNNNLISDTLYYFSPHYGPIIRQIVVDTMVQLYQDFQANHQDQEVVSVCLLAHSLGGIICRDIMCDADLSKQLPFKVDCMFLAGCSLAAALVMRGQDNEHVQLSTDSDIRVYNIYNRYDPFAYRLEPLIYPSHDIQELPDAVHIPSLQLPGKSSSFVVTEEGSYIRRFASVFSLSLFSSWMPSLSNSIGDQSPRLSNQNIPKSPKNGTKRPRSVVEQEDAEIDLEIAQHDQSIRARNNDLTYGLFASIRSLFRRETITIETEDVLVSSSGESPKSQRSTSLPTRYDYELENQAVLLNIKNEYVNGILAHFCYWFYPSFVNLIMEKALHHSSNSNE